MTDDPRRDGEDRPETYTDTELHRQARARQEARTQLQLAMLQCLKDQPPHTPYTPGEPS